MSRLDILCKCTRCKNTHMESSRVSVLSKSMPGAHELVCPKCNCKSFFDMTPSVAWCWASGLIDIGETAPEGSIKIAEGPLCELKLAVDVAARHGKGGMCLIRLVPGVPEADTQEEKGDALSKWLELCARSCRQRTTVRGIVFMTELHQQGGAA